MKTKLFLSLFFLLFLALNGFSQACPMGTSLAWDDSDCKYVVTLGGFGVGPSYRISWVLEPGIDDADIIYNGTPFPIYTSAVPTQEYDVVVTIYGILGTNMNCTMDSYDDECP